MTHKEQRDRRKAMALEVKRGADPDKVARKYRVSGMTVYFACRENGVERNGRSMSPSTYSVIGALQEGRSGESIAQDFGVSPQWISRVRVACIQAGVRGIPNRKNGKEARHA